MRTIFFNRDSIFIDLKSKFLNPYLNFVERIGMSAPVVANNRYKTDLKKILLGSGKLSGVSRNEPLGTIYIVFRRTLLSRTRETGNLFEIGDSRDHFLKAVLHLSVYLLDFRSISILLLLWLGLPCPQAPSEFVEWQETGRADSGKNGCTNFFVQRLN